MAHRHQHREDLQRLVASSEPLRKLQPFFSNWEDVLSFHARQMSVRFPAGGETSGCAACEAPAPLVPTTLRWRATYGNTRTALVTLLTLLHHSAHMQLDFETHHRFCANCYRRTVLHRVLAELTRHVVFIILLLLGGIFAMSLLWLMVVIMDFTWANFGWFALAFFSGGFGVVGGLWAKATMDRWCIPVPLRFIGKYPFVLYGVKRT